MKKTALFVSLVIASVMSVFAATAAGNDPVVMKVNGLPVTLSEFEYLYKKNNAQQVLDLSLDEYVKMFVTYKLKVCAARAAGLDTVSSFRSDMSRYASELAMPYFTDRELADSLIGVAYANYRRVVTLHHLLLPPYTSDRDEKAQLALADSLRERVLGGEDFEDIIRRYSVDPQAPKKHGYMRFSGGMLPYPFEEVAFSTPVGTLSKVFRTPYGIHLLKVDACEDDPGEVKTRHILKLTQGLDETASLQKKAAIDSLKKCLDAGADFATVASMETEDPSGRKNGGDLPWFGVGRMVPEFEEAAFALPDGKVSDPVRTAYGYHLILRQAWRPTRPLDSVRSDLEMIMSRDYRSEMVRQRVLDKCLRSAGGGENARCTRKIAKILKENGGLNQASRNKILALKDAAFTIGDKKYPVSEVVSRMRSDDIPGEAGASVAYRTALRGAMNAELKSLFETTLADREPSYRNLLNEYAEGNLLYEISSRMVWDRANSDREGLAAYYAAHIGDFRWDAPHYKGFVISAESDSVADAALAYLDGITAADADFATELRKKFGRTAKVERVLAAKGDNKVIDYVGFAGTRPEGDRQWKAYRGYRGSVIDQPESVDDVRSLVSMAYQQHLEDEWVAALRERYPVEIYRERLAHLE